MNNFNNKNLKNIYNEFLEIQNIYKVAQESLCSCYEEDKDYSHVFGVYKIFSDKLDKAISDLEKYIEYTLN